MKRIFACLPVFLVLLWSPRFAAAQSTFDLNVGFGWANAKALPGVDISTFGPCTSATTAATRSFLPYLTLLSPRSWFGHSTNRRRAKASSARSTGRSADHPLPSDSRDGCAGPECPIGPRSNLGSAKIPDWWTESR